jgi:hypothetical protein
MTRSQQDVDRILKCVDTKITEFTNCWQKAKVDAVSRLSHSQCEKLKELSSALQQQRSQLLSLCSKSGMRKSQRREVDAAQGSIDNALENFEAFERELNQDGDIVKEDVEPETENVDERLEDTSGERAKVYETISSEEVMLMKDDGEMVKVQWEQLLREEEDDREMLEEFICKICQVHVVGCGPKLTRCSHLFCGDCIAKWFEMQPRSQSWAQRAQSGGLVPCPVCKEPLHQERDLFPVCSTGNSQSALLWRFLSNVKIVCANNQRCRADGKCTWVGEYGSYQKHLQTCENLPLPQSTEATLQKHVQNLPLDEATSQGVAPRVCHPHAAELDAKSLKAEEGIQVAADFSQNSKDGSLIDLIQQLVDIEVQSNVIEHAAIETDSASQLSQPAVQQKSEKPARAVSAIRSFAANGPSQLGVQKGDLIEVLNQHESGWTYGRKVHQDAESKHQKFVGWFPNWAIV